MHLGQDFEYGNIVLVFFVSRTISLGGVTLYHVAFARTFKISFNEEFLFPTQLSDGSVKPGKRWTA